MNSYQGLLINSANGSDDTVVADIRGSNTFKESAFAAPFASKGVFELALAAILQFPTVFDVVRYGSAVVGWIAKHYYSIQNRVRNTDASVDLAA